MDHAKAIKGAISAAIAFFTSLWGWIGWCVVIFLLSMFLDYLTGSWAAIRRGEWSSAAARDGLWHKLGEIAALLVGALCDIAIIVIMQTAAAPLFERLPWDGYVTMLVCVWYIFTELGSVIENAGKLGAPVPSWIARGIATLRGRVDEKQADKQADKNADDE